MPGNVSFEEFYDDADAKVLVIWLSKLSYSVLTNPEVKTVREARLEYIGQYHEYFVVKRVREDSTQVDDPWLEDEVYDGQDDEAAASYQPCEKFEVREGTKELLDRLYARKSILISAEELGKHYELSNTDPWWENESPGKHYGNANADILLIVLA